ncbi:uncharacterized protein LOC117335731 [Pecten maximus]|uniref:uncharacterized protein LOC117335731 n=1 Tax=Pecten maximus TaxID=6579 RepID=UPI001458AF0F|nr:uncharacterized protein LOC117335731 [Pecten maximus]
MQGTCKPDTRPCLIDMAGKRTGCETSDLVEEAATPCKNLRGNDEDIIFLNFPDKLCRRIAIRLGELCCSGQYTFSALQFLNCNGADETGGVPFSKAYCSIKPIGGKRKIFGSIFKNGLNLLSEFVEKRTIPQNRQEKFVLRKLLQYLTDKDAQAALKDLDKFEETHLTMVLANHLFGKLATSSKYTIDKSCDGKVEKCPCRAQCQLTGNFGDTSIGNEEVWHGNLNIVVNNDVIVSRLVDDPQCPGGKSSEEAKTISSTSILKRNPQIIAQSVVFSFLQKQTHPLSRHFMFPCIGIGSGGLVVYFYDSEHDVLLESTYIPLLVGPTSLEDRYPSKLNLITILVSWFVVNYKYLCSGLPESLKTDGKANFFTQAKAKLDIYENCLKAGNVGVSVFHHDTDSDVDSDSDADFFTEMQIKLIRLARKAKNAKERNQEVD